MHVPYACRHSGVCCSSGWAIAVEHTRARAIGMLRGDGSWLWPAPDVPPDVAGTIAVATGGHCTFHRDGCEIQGAYGHAAMPVACQHFPREVLIDGRGVSVTLSHYCPTAADLLFDHAGPVEVVEGPPAVPAGEPEGLDARDVLPPLLTDGVLMDLEAYSAWEAHMVAVLTADDGRTPDEALALLEGDLATMRRWRPGRHALTEEISRLGARQTVAGQASAAGNADLVIRRYLAARAFASWMAYQAGGIAAVLRSLRFVLSALGDRRAHFPLREAIRQTDLQILHLMSRDDVAAIARHPADGTRVDVRTRGLSRAARRQ
jgi:hypothetical protein